MLSRDPLYSEIKAIHKELNDSIRNKNKEINKYSLIEAHELLWLQFHLTKLKYYFHYFDYYMLDQGLLLKLEKFLRKCNARIAESPEMCYTNGPYHAAAKLCYKIAELLAKKANKHPYEYLFPTIVADHNLVTDENLFELKMDEFIICENRYYAFPVIMLHYYIQAENEKQRNQALWNPYIQTTLDEKREVTGITISDIAFKKLINHSLESKEYYEAWQALELINNNENSISNRLKKFAIELRKGGVKGVGNHIGNGKELDAGIDTYNAVIEFREFLDSMDENSEIRKKIEGLVTGNYYGSECETLLIVVEILERKRFGYDYTCSNTNAGKIESILAHEKNHDFLYGKAISQHFIEKKNKFLQSLENNDFTIINNEKPDELNLLKNIIYFKRSLYLLNNISIDEKCLLNPLQLALTNVINSPTIESYDFVKTVFTLQLHNGNEDKLYTFVSGMIYAEQRGLEGERTRQFLFPCINYLKSIRRSLKNNSSIFYNDKQKIIFEIITTYFIKELFQEFMRVIVRSRDFALLRQFFAFSNINREEQKYLLEIMLRNDGLLKLIDEETFKTIINLYEKSGENIIELFTENNFLINVINNGRKELVILLKQKSITPNENDMQEIIRIINARSQTKYHTAHFIFMVNQFFANHISSSVYEAAVVAGMDTFFEENSRSINLLIYAIEKNNVLLLKTLIKFGFDINQVFSFVVKSGNIPVIISLLKTGKVKPDTDIANPLIDLFVRKNNAELAKEFFNCGYNQFLKNYYYLTKVFLHSKNIKTIDLKIIELFLDSHLQNQNINESIYVYHNDLDKMDIAKTTKVLDTIMIPAIRHGRVDIACLLIAKGGKLENVEISFNDRTTYHAMISHLKEIQKWISPSQLRMILEKNPDALAILNENAFVALEKKLITPEDVCQLPIKILKLLITHNGLKALQNNEITVSQAMRMNEYALTDQIANQDSHRLVFRHSFRF